MTLWLLNLILYKMLTFLPTRLTVLYAVFSFAIQMTWINFLVSSSNTGTHSTSGCPTIISRSEWGARAPTQHNSRLPATPGHVYIHHGATPGCHTKAECIQRVRSYQNYHMDSHGKGEVTFSPSKLCTTWIITLIDNALFLLFLVNAFNRNVQSWMYEFQR